MDNFELIGLCAIADAQAQTAKALKDNQLKEEAEKAKLEPIVISAYNKNNTEVSRVPTSVTEDTVTRLSEVKILDKFEAIVGANKYYRIVTNYGQFSVLKSDYSYYSIGDSITIPFITYKSTEKVSSKIELERRQAKAEKEKIEQEKEDKLNKGTYIVSCIILGLVAIGIIVGCICGAKKHNKNTQNQLISSEVIDKSKYLGEKTYKLGAQYNSFTIDYVSASTNYSYYNVDTYCKNIFIGLVQTDEVSFTVDILDNLNNKKISTIHTEGLYIRRDSRTLVDYLTRENIFQKLV